MDYKKLNYFLFPMLMLALVAEPFIWDFPWRMSFVDGFMVATLLVLWFSTIVHRKQVRAAWFLIIIIPVVIGSFLWNGYRSAERKELEEKREQRREHMRERLRSHRESSVPSIPDSIIRVSKTAQ